MIDFKKCLECGDVLMTYSRNSKLSVDTVMHKLAMGSKMKRFNGKGCWEFRFCGFDSITKDLGDEERFARVEKFDWKNIRRNDDGSCTLVLLMRVWENIRLFKAHKNELAIAVPLELTFTPGKKNSWNTSRDIFSALLCFEEIRSLRKKVLTLEAQDNGTTIVTAPDKSSTEVNTLVMEKVQELIEEFGINVMSLDVDNVKCAMGEINYLNLHIDNPEVLKNDAFKEKRYALTEFADKYDWDVWFVAPGHSRNPFIESLNAL